MYQPIKRSVQLQPILESPDEDSRAYGYSKGYNQGFSGQKINEGNKRLVNYIQGYYDGYNVYLRGKLRLGMK